MTHVLAPMFRLVYFCSFVLITSCDGSPASNPSDGHQEEEFGPNNSTDFSVLSAASDWWRGLSELDRAENIVRTAWSDYGRNVGLNCKLWLQQRAVFNASRGVVTLPLTVRSRNDSTIDSSGSAWAWSPYTYEVTSSYYRLGPANTFLNARRGDIVQMRWRLNNGTITPHSALIYEVSWPLGVWFIESNWEAANTVGLRWVSFDELAQRTLEYNIYRITGGW